MKLSKLGFLYVFLSISATSCLQEEALNTEADITSVSFEGNILLNSTIDFNPSYDERIEAYPLLINVKKGTDLTDLKPSFELTPGASINPESNVNQNFTMPVKYTVTSEDKKWKRVYMVTVQEKVTGIPTSFHFEDIRLIKDKYQEFYEIQNENELTWASGNEGFNFAVGNAKIEDYPTVQYAEGKIGKCAKLETRKTGSLGQMVKMPIAAGNLFIGNFNMLDAISNPLGATRFGAPFFKRPLRFTGYYKYKSGEKFYENGKYTSRKDTPSIYAIFYEVTDDINMLDGNLANQDFLHPNMVALASLPDPHETEEWVFFNIPFDYNRYGKTIDAAKLADGEYKLGIVLASSKDGAVFQGAPGSTLLIDEIELIYE